MKEFEEIEQKLNEMEGKIDRILGILEKESALWGPEIDPTLTSYTLPIESATGTPPHIDMED